MNSHINKQHSLMPFCRRLSTAVFFEIQLMLNQPGLGRLLHRIRAPLSVTGLSKQTPNSSIKMHSCFLMELKTLITNGQCFQLWNAPNSLKFEHNLAACQRLSGFCSLTSAYERQCYDFTVISDTPINGIALVQPLRPKKRTTISLTNLSTRPSLMVRALCLLTR